MASLVARRGAILVARLVMALAGALLGAPAVVTADEVASPKRVVSINLCTDQLAMMLAAPGQLYSVSFLARDARASAMTEEARSYVINHGRAEEIYLMQPDLVMAGAFAARDTVAMLRRLGIPVVVFDPVTSLEDVRDRIMQTGDVLQRRDAARAMLVEFDAGLAAARAAQGRRPRAVLYDANGYTAGDDSLAGEIIQAAGYANAASDTGAGTSRKLSLELLAMLAPEVVITTQRYPGQSRAEAIMDHPVVRALQGAQAGVSVTDHNWVCGTPHVLRAIETLSESRRALTGADQ